MTASASTADDREIRCPRCGYDQRGVVTTWKESCPFTGICTECGLEFNWCEVLVPEKFEPRWCIEYEPKKLRLPWAAMRTYFRSFIPWLFWSRLKMSDAIRWRRLLMYPLLLLLPLVILYALAQGSLAIYVRQQVEEQFLMQARQRPAAIQNMQAGLKQWIALPASGDAWQDQQMQRQIAAVKAEIARQQAAGTAPDYIDSSVLVTTWEAIVNPFAGYSSATIMSPTAGVIAGYIPPIALLAVLTQSQASWSFNWVGASTLPVAWMAWGVATTFLLPVSFILMPFSLRKAKVRWAHIVRVTIYSLFIPITCLAAAFLLIVGAAAFSNETAMELFAVGVRYVPWLAVALWWHAATSRYLRIPHAWLTIAMLTLMCLLILLGITSAVSTELAWQMLDLFDWMIQ